jgi:hypothetical protein
MRDSDAPGLGWKLLNSWWVLLTVLGLGCLGGAGFLYVGLRARRRAWWIAGIGYLVLSMAGLVGIDRSPYGSPALTTVAMAYYGLWFASIVHALIVNPEWLRWLAGRRPRPHLAPPPGFVVEVNSATVRQLVEVAGLDPARAERIVAQREARGGFQSVVEFAAAGGLAPHEFVRLRDRLTCAPRPGASQPHMPQPRVPQPGMPQSHMPQSHMPQSHMPQPQTLPYPQPGGGRVLDV